jgi:hypothetical protein
MAPRFEWDESSRADCTLADLDDLAWFAGRKVEDRVRPPFEGEYPHATGPGWLVKVRIKWNKGLRHSLVPPRLMPRKQLRGASPSSRRRRSRAST